MQRSITQKQPWYAIVLLVMAGEAVFILPFVLARVFRSTFLAAFQLDNTELGYCFALYGIVAVVSYLIGGPLADRFQPKNLMAIGLIATALGGLYMATFPGYEGLKLLFAYWGATTILLFWAAMIKATRLWGGGDGQVKAFGILEGGRGLVAATVGLVCVFIFSVFVGENVADLAEVERQLALRQVILFLSGFVGVIGVLVFLFMPTSAQKEKTSRRIDPEVLVKTLKIPAVWLMMIIVLCAYVGYKITGIIPQHAHEIVGLDEVVSAEIGTFLLYLRPVAAFLMVIAVGRYRLINWLIGGFVLMALGALLYVMGVINTAGFVTTLIVVFIISLGIFGVRALYFALLQAGHIPLSVTGTAVGLISVVGYAPDIFMGPLMGYFLDNYPGQTGYQAVFGITAAFAVVGIGAVILFARYNKRLSVNGE